MLYPLWCMELIKRYPKAFGLKDYTCIDEDDQESAFKLLLGNLYNVKKSIKIQDKIILKPAAIQSIYSFARNTLCNLTSSIGHYFMLTEENEALPDKGLREIKDICENVIKAYMEYKRSRRYIDYDDMLYVVAQALRRNAALRDQISSLYSHILVDEVQDTNPLQWLLLESFYDNCHLFCVGDDAQSIYAFRGADFKSVHSFLQRVPNSEVYKLTENYRSTQEILDVSNWMLSKSPLEYGKDLVAHNGHGQKPVMYLLDDDWSEANVIKDTVLKGKEDGKKYGDYLVLSRSAYGLKKVESAFISNNIPYLFFGGTKLMQSAHIRDVVSAMRVVANYHDELAWMRYLTIWPNMGEKTAAKVVESVMEKESIGDAISCIDSANRTTPENRKEMKDCLESIASLGSDPAGAIELLVKKMEPVLSKSYDNWDYRKRDFEALKMVASKSLDIASFIAEYILDPSVELSAKEKLGDDNDDCAILSTIHSAKGLEADTCFIVNVTPFSYPSSKATTVDEIEEERRCLYVALTRAKNSLNIMSRKISVSATVPTGTAFFESESSDVPIGEVLAISSPVETDQERKSFQSMVSVHFFEDDREVTMTEGEFRSTYYINSDITSSDENYFLNGLPDDMVTLSVKGSGKGSGEEGFGHPWMNLSDASEEDLMDLFDFS